MWWGERRLVVPGQLQSGRENTLKGWGTKPGTGEALGQVILINMNVVDNPEFNAMLKCLPGK